MKSFDVQRFRKKFPFFDNNDVVDQINSQLSEPKESPEVVYFDNAATTQKPKTVIESINHYYASENANVHRSSHRLSARATQKFEASRTLVRDFINAKSDNEIIWTKGTTESINLIASSWGNTFILPGDEIVVSHGEHHANIVPWQELAKRIGAKLVVLPLDNEGRIATSALEKYINERTKIVAINWISNVLGKVNPVNEIIQFAKVFGALTIVDAAQTIAHFPVDVVALDCDFLVFSGHKMFGPTGTGVLYGKEAILNKMPPYQFGGEMIKKVSFSGTTFGELPFKFETGTPNIAGIIGLGEAIKCCSELFQSNVQAYENKLICYTYEQLKTIEQIQFLVEQQPDIPVFSFHVIEHNNKDIATFLDSHGIAVRAGHHCAMPLMEYLNIDGCIRLSLAPYNTKEEVDYLITNLKAFLLNDVLAEQSREYQRPTPNAVSIVTKLKQAKGWDGRHREIMLLSKQLERLPTAMRTDQSVIDGCESSAWLVAQKKHDGSWQFSADSDAKVIRGLMVIVLSIYQNKSSQDILAFDVDDYFKQLGLIEHLSPSRGNGLRAIVAKIKMLVAD